MSASGYEIGFLWDQCCDYHMDRAEALARALGGEGRVTLFEVAGRSRLYDWPACRHSDLVERVTLFPEIMVEDAGEIRTAVTLLRAMRKRRVRHLFLAGYEHPGRFLLAVILKLAGRAPVLVIDSKFDDKPRRLGLEWLKYLLLLPYRAGFVSGRRAAGYLRFLGFRRRKIMAGCNTLSLARLRALAPDIDAPWSQRPFLIVARMVPKKNLTTAMRAFAALGDTPRQLRICGDGPLRGDLEELAGELGIADRTIMLGSVSQEVVAREMAAALCLLLPSVEEQWGLVINEALAFGLPLIASENVGAKDLLIGNFINGFLLDPKDVEGWTQAMRALDSDQELWERFVKGSTARAPDADVSRFVESALSLAGKPQD